MCRGGQLALFREIRLWIRRAPIGERLAAGAGLALALGVVAWLLVPVGTHETTNGIGVGGGPTQSNSAEQGNSPTPTSGAGGSVGESATTVVNSSGAAG